MSVVCVFYDFGEDGDEEWLEENILGHKWKGKSIEFLIQWNLGDTTWEPCTDYLNKKQRIFLRLNFSLCL